MGNYPEASRHEDPHYAQCEYHQLAVMFKEADKRGIQAYLEKAKISMDDLIERMVCGIFFVSSSASAIASDSRLCEEDILASFKNLEKEGKIKQVEKLRREEDHLYRSTSIYKSIIYSLFWSPPRAVSRNG